MIELRAGRLRCELSPGLGGAIAGLWLDDVPVLRSTPAAALASARQAGCIPLVPFSNRVGHASVQWEGTVLPLIRHPGDAPHAILGVGAHRPWEVLENDETTAMLACEHRGDTAWPFGFDCSHTLRLRPDALELTLAVTNQSGQAAPASLGWRPALARRPGARLSFHAAGLWQPGPTTCRCSARPRRGSMRTPIRWRPRPATTAGTAWRSSPNPTCVCASAPT